MPFSAEAPVVDWQELLMPTNSRFPSNSSIPEDVALLLGSFKEIAGLHYVDFMNMQQAHRAIQRWPLFRLRQTHGAQSAAELSSGDKR